MSQAHPVLYNIDYSGSYRPFPSKKFAVRSKYKIFTSYYSIECYTVQITKPLAWVPNIDPSGHFNYPYIYICLYLSYQLIIEDFVVEIHHGHFHSFVNAFFLNFGFTKVINVFPAGISKILNKTFLCLNVPFRASKLLFPSYHCY